MMPRNRITSFRCMHRQGGFILLMFAVLLGLAAMLAVLFWKNAHARQQVNLRASTVAENMRNAGNAFQTYLKNYSNQLRSGDRASCIRVADCRLPTLAELNALGFSIHDGNLDLKFAVLTVGSQITGYVYTNKPIRGVTGLPDTVLAGRVARQIGAYGLLSSADTPSFFGNGVMQITNPTYQAATVAIYVFVN